VIGLLPALAAASTQCAPVDVMLLRKDVPARFGPQLVHRTSANFATAYNRACAKGYMKSKPLIGVKGANAKKLFLYNAPNANVASIYSSGSRTLLEYPFVSEDGKTQVPSFEELMEAIYCAAHGATKQEQEDSGTCLPD